MKIKIFSSFILSLCAVMGFSQTILYQAETTTRTVQDPQTVVLAQGFQASGSVSNPFIAKIGPGTENPGGGPADSNAGANNPSGTTAPAGKSFHDTQGNINVTSAGQLQYSLALSLPSGIKEVAPRLDLTYLSGSGNGIAGYGWSVSGVTSISRIGKTIEKDGEVGGIQLDYSDYYSFNGQRLILKSGEYGKDGAEYVTEKYSNIKIRSVGAITGQSWQGPEYWEVTFEDGSQAWYGGITNGNNPARNQLEYNIVKWKDKQGNYITYNYLQNNNIPLISSIHWGGNENLGKVHFNTVQFNYLGRSITETFYKKGILFKQDKILGSINVLTNNLMFKSYNINYSSSENVNNNNAHTVHYQFVTSVTEINKGGENANPVEFSTKPLQTKVNEYNFNDYGDIVTTGDFNGDGLVDFIAKKYLPGTLQSAYYLYFDAVNTGTNYVYLGTDANLFPGFISSTGTKTQLLPYNLKSADNYVKTKQGILTISSKRNISVPYEPFMYDIELRYFSIKNDASVLNTNNSALVLEYSKTIGFGDYQYDPSLYPNQPDPGYSYADDEEVSAWIDSKEVDIDSDGLSEIMLSIADVKCYKKELSTYPEDVYSWECANAGSRFFVIDKDDIANNTFHTTAAMNKNLFQPIGNGRSQIMDFDNDGIQDIMLVEPTGNYSNVNFYTKDFINGSIQNTTVNTTVNKLSQYEVKKEAGEYVVNFKNSFTVKGLPYAVQFGDLNGDNNIEVLLPLHEYNVNDQLTTGWSIYQNTGTNLEESLQGLMIYRNYPTSATDVSTNPALIDIDGDGKGEIINSYSWFSSINTNLNINWRLDSFSEAYYNPSDLQFKWRFQEKRLMSSERAKASILPLFGSFRVNGSFSKILFLLKATNSNEQKVISYEHYNINFDKNITEIKQGGIVYNIDYLELNPAINSNIYSTVKKEQYPFVELERLDQTYAVSRIRYLNRKQDFRYRGYISHLQGRGIVGFRQTARSSWYADGFENTKIWNGVEIDPLNYGVPIKEWSIRTNDESKIFPADISENNTQLLTFKSTYYETNNLLNGQLVSTVPDADKPKIVKAIIPKNNYSKDFLANTSISSSVTYGNYYLPAQSISNINNGYGIKTSVFEYDHNPSGTGANYYIGRPTVKTDIVQAYGDSKSLREEYTYDNNLLKTLKTWNRDNSGYLMETYDYDDFGNITQKVTSNSVDSQTQTVISEYDSKGRFVVKKTDNLQQQTGFSYNDSGQILTQTDALDNTLINTYDNWGKLLKSKNNLNGTTTYQYNRDDNENIIVIQYDSDGDISKKYTNILGQEYKNSTKAFGQGQYISKDSQYDVLGRKIGESEPYFEGASNIQWNTIQYDDTLFPAKITAQSFSGKQMETSISGLTTTVKESNPQDYGRITTKTADALGNIISTTDKGGTINFTYNAAGEQIKAQYAENIVTSKYNAWGKKSEFNDPSNGVYKYEYGGFGQSTKIISPKGTKEFTYNNLGQLVTQKELSITDGGQATNKIITFTYDNKGHIISKSGTSKGNSYLSKNSFDSQGRTIAKSEESNGKYFIQKGITYDDKGRVISYEKQLFSSGIMTKIKIENVYSAWDGELYQIKDQSSGKVLWQLNETNARGQATSSRLGGVNITNNYDINSGFLASASHSSQTAVVLQLAYTFNSIRNKLESRTRGGDFNITEMFDYDDNNRLINWTDPVTGIKPAANRNVYDIKGRIIENDQVGTMKYENSAKTYQPTGMILNAAGEQNYNNDLIQTIAYNENNDPVFIDGIKGDVAFQYGLTNMRQKVTYGGNFATGGNGKYTKFYNEDGSYEVQLDNTTGTEKHILYIGGNPYDSNIIFVKNYGDTAGSYQFLHKDYLGSILAITDENGYKTEQRHFDAWGNMTHYKKGNKSTVTDRDLINTLIANGNLLIDRGYTGHEHLPEVGIIHMNGRLYDPLLRRFLNADENIQDPTNTQNYNKYGYVLNNPLMFNDPSGEFFIAISIPVFIVGALKAVVIAGLIYTAMAAVTGNASKAGFLKSVVTSFITGGIGAGVGALNVFGNGFWGTVAQGMVIGAAGGALDAVISGNNVLSGIIKGAVIGGAIAIVSYTVSYYVKGLYKSQEVTTNDISVDESAPLETDLQKMGQNIKAARANLPIAKELNISFEGVGLSNPDGYMLAADGKTWNVLGKTSPVDFSSGKQSILYSVRAASNFKLLGRVMSHETAHAMSNAFKFPKKNIRKRLEVVDDLALNTIDHLVIRKLEYTLLYRNFLLPTGQGLPSMDVIDIHISLLNPSEKFLFNFIYNKFAPLFNVQYKFPTK